MPGAEALPEQFDSGIPSNSGPLLVYPADGTLMPINVAPVLFQWEGREGSAYRLVIEGSGRVFEVFTTGWNWEPEEVVWRAITRAGSAVEMSVRVDQLVADAIALSLPLPSLLVLLLWRAIYFWSPHRMGLCACRSVRPLQNSF